MSESGGYPLGMAAEEVDRLAHQHDTWRDATARWWARAGIGPGRTVVDLGSGPGFTTLDLARLVGPEGRVVAVDNSPRALALLRERAAAAGLGHVETVESDVATCDLAVWTPDVVAARWLFWLLLDPAALVRRVGAALRPGARLAVMDYANYRAIGTEPASPLFERVFRAVYQSCADAGGSLDVAGRLPALLLDAGFDVTAVEPLAQIGRPGSPVWQWVTTFQRLYFPTLVEQGYLPAADVAAFHAWWAELGAAPGALFFAPPMLGVVGTRR